MKWLDVVYNHTAEGDNLGPTIYFRGIDNATFYRLKEDKALYEDTTGTGNSLNMTMFGVLRFIMDSLRYWVTEMHVDVNFVTAHDGFTLQDLVSYNTKHNELNKNDNNDGSKENHSFNFGVEDQQKIFQSLN